MEKNRESAAWLRSRRQAVCFAAVCMAAAFSVMTGCSVPAKSRSSASVYKNAGSSTTASKTASKPVLPASTASESAASASSVRQGDLSDCAMIGNSYVNTLETYGLIPQMDFYDRVGLSVLTVFKQPTSTGKTPIIDALGVKKYRVVYLLFGENELGWEGTKPFYNAYAAVVDAVRARQPDAKIVIESIFPLSAAKSAKNEDGANNTRIVEYNNVLRELAKNKGAVYLDVWSVMAGPGGALPAGDASDGIHPNKKTCRLWVDYLKSHAQ